MLHFLISFAGIIITILFVVGTHEAGHFAAARAVGVKVLTFSIGFGKTLFKWRDKSGTEYVFALIPLGGYIRMLDQSEGEVSKDEVHLAYSSQPLYKKCIIVLAGPMMNFICAMLLYWLIFTIGFVTIKPVIGAIKLDSIAAEAGLKPLQQITSIDQHDVQTWTNILFRVLAHTGSQDQLTIGVTGSNNQQHTYTMNLANWKMDKLNPDPLQSLGITPYEPPIALDIGHIRENSAAARSDLKLGDKILMIDHQKIKDWTQVMETVQSHPDQSLTFTIKRDGKNMDLPVLVGSQRTWLLSKTGALGIGPFFEMPKEMQQHIQYSPLSAIPKALQETYDLISFNILLFGKMITGKLSLESLGGPITIFDSAGDSLNYGFLPFISFLAFLSTSIGVINLFPIPGLDGGHLFIQLIESISRRSIPDHILSFTYKMGFLFLILIIIQAMINDVLRLF